MKRSNHFSELINFLQIRSHSSWRMRCQKILEWIFWVHYAISQWSVQYNYIAIEQHNWTLSFLDDYIYAKRWQGKHFLYWEQHIRNENCVSINGISGIMALLLSSIHTCFCLVEASLSYKVFIIFFSFQFLP